MVVDGDQGVTAYVTEHAPAQAAIQPLDLVALRRAGALSIPAAYDRETNDLIADQRERYQAFSKDDLIEELLRRDRIAVAEGRALADGTVGGRLLREFVRGVLHHADHTALQQIDRKGRILDDGTKAGVVENLLRALGAEPADNRELRLHGHTLGPQEELSEAEREQIGTEARTAGSARVAKEIRQHRETHVTSPVTPVKEDERNGPDPE